MTETVKRLFRDRRAMFGAAVVCLLAAAAVLAPLIVAGVGIILSIIGVLLVRCGEETSMKKLMGALERGTNFANIAIIVVM